MVEVVEEVVEVLEVVVVVEVVLEVVEGLFYINNFPGHRISPPRLNDSNLLLEDKFSL